MSKVGDLLRQLAFAYDEMQQEIDVRLNYQEERLSKQDKKLFKIQQGLKSLVYSLENEEDNTIDFNQN